MHADELKQLCHEYNDILSAGLTNGYAVASEYHENDCVFIDNLAVAQQGLRIMHRSTAKGVKGLAPEFGLPQQANIDGPNPVGEGVWQGGGVGFRWDEAIPMRN